MEFELENGATATQPELKHVSVSLPPPVHLANITIAAPAAELDATVESLGTEAQDLRFDDALHAKALEIQSPGGRSGI